MCSTYVPNLSKLIRYSYLLGRRVQTSSANPNFLHKNMLEVDINCLNTSQFHSSTPQVKELQNNEEKNIQEVTNKDSVQVLLPSSFGDKEHINNSKRIGEKSHNTEIANIKSTVADSFEQKNTKKTRSSVEMKSGDHSKSSIKNKPKKEINEVKTQMKTIEASVIVPENHAKSKSTQSMSDSHKTSQDKLASGEIKLQGVDSKNNTSNTLVVTETKSPPSVKVKQFNTAENKVEKKYDSSNEIKINNMTKSDQQLKTMNQKTNLQAPVKMLNGLEAASKSQGKSEFTQELKMNIVGFRNDPSNIPIVTKTKPSQNVVEPSKITDKHEAGTKHNIDIKLQEVGYKNVPSTSSVVTKTKSPPSLKALHLKAVKSEVGKKDEVSKEIKIQNMKESGSKNEIALNSKSPVKILDVLEKASKNQQNLEIKQGVKVNNYPANTHDAKTKSSSNVNASSNSAVVSETESTPRVETQHLNETKNKMEKKNDLSKEMEIRNIEVVTPINPQIGLSSKSPVDILDDLEEASKSQGLPGIRQEVKVNNDGFKNDSTNRDTNIKPLPSMGEPPKIMDQHKAENNKSNEVQMEKVNSKSKMVDQLLSSHYGLNETISKSSQNVIQNEVEPSKGVDKFDIKSRTLNSAKVQSNQQGGLKMVDQQNISKKYDTSDMKIPTTLKPQVNKTTKPPFKVKYRLKATLKEMDSSTSNLQITRIRDNLIDQKINTMLKNDMRSDQGLNFINSTIKDEPLPFGSHINAVEKSKSTNEDQQQKSVALKKDLNDHRALTFDSSYLISQIVRSRQSISFEEIPGPKLMKMCSSIVNALPVIGTQTITSLMRSYNRLCLSYGDTKLIGNKFAPFQRLFNSYGDIVCLHIPLCDDIVMVDKPELIHEVYKQRDMSQVMNSNFDSLNEVYNILDKSRIKINANLVDHMPYIIDDNDPNSFLWASNRDHDALEKISESLVERIVITRDIHNEVPADFIKELTKWSLECMMQVLFATQVGFLKTDDHFAFYESERILNALNDATDALRSCESGIQLWRVYQTSSFTKLSRSVQNIESFLCKHIPLLKLDHGIDTLQSSFDPNLNTPFIRSSLISGLILSGYVDIDKLLKICVETMLVAVNTTATSLGFILYHLARCQDKQRKLHKELMSVLPEKSSTLEPGALQELPYLNACIQESLRLKHPIPYSVVKLQRSIVLNKYYIPAGTWVMTANEVACLREEIFYDATKFRPERWLDCSAELYQDTISPLIEAQFAPFLGADWLQKQLAIGTAKIIRNFNVNYRYGEINKDGEFLSKPSKPFQFEFQEHHI